jgi:hypothetical protein
VLTKLNWIPTGICLTSAAFYRLRRVLITTFGAERKQVRLATPLEILIPPDERRHHWHHLGECLGRWRLPELERPRWLRCGLFLPSLAITISGMALGMMTRREISLFGWGLAIGGLLLLFLGYKLTVSLVVCIPAECKTVRETVHTLLRMNYGDMAASAGRIYEPEIWQSLCAIIGANLGVDAKILTPDTRFVEDLGTD